MLGKATWQTTWQRQAAQKDTSNHFTPETEVQQSADNIPAVKKAARPKPSLSDQLIIAFVVDHTFGVRRRNKCDVCDCDAILTKHK